MLLQVQTTYFGELSFQPWEYIAVPLILILIFAVSARHRNRKIRENPAYKYYIAGLFAKIAGGIALCFIYVYYYPGGDTTAYYESGVAMVNLAHKSPFDFLTVLFGNNSEENRYLFDSNTGYPLGYMYFDVQTFTVIRIISPLLLVTFKSYLLSTILLAWISYIGIWKLYLLFQDHFKPLSFELAVAILFIPSVVFWGSGILKDTITFSAACWFVHGWYHTFVIKKSKFTNALIIFLSASAIMGTKPYVLITLLPGALIWIFYQRILKIKNRALLLIYIPGIYLLSIGGGFFILSQLGSRMAKFSVDKVFSTAAVIQQDLTDEKQYGSHSYNIGSFDASVGGVIGKAPAAVTAGLFRPFLWESNNIVMLLSGLENSFILLLSVILLIRIRILRIVRIIFKNPLLLFSLSYSILFAFSVGLTSANFGALVRYKIPLLPFFVASLFILSYFIKKRNIDPQISQ